MSKPRSSFALCHEASHYILLEQKKRVNLGVPHTHLTDIVNDWILAHGQALGYPPPGHHVEKIDFGGLYGKCPKRFTLARMEKRT
jgi:hypothetical protein